MDKMNIPDNYRLLYSSSEITNIIKEISIKLQQHLNYFQYDQPPIFVNILKGGTVFFSQLIQQIPFSIELGNISASSYYDNTSNGYVSIDYLDFNANEKIIFLVDDIFDSGATLSSIKEKLLKEGAKEVWTISLIYRTNCNKLSIHEPDLYGFELDTDDWVVGFGMDDRGLYRNLQDIYTIKRTND